MLPVAAIPPESQLQGAMLLFSIVALGLVGIGVILGLILTRRRQWRRLQEKESRKQPVSAVDPWEESARRMAVPPCEDGAEDGLEENVEDIESWETDEPDEEDPLNRP